jgi:uncharacterized OB-fold protein
VDTWIKEPCSNYERINTELERWRLDDEYGYRGLRCPKCGNEFECYFDDIDEIWNYCPQCGKRLLPPEEKSK